MRNGLRSPQAKVSRQRRPGSVRPVAAHESASSPMKGLVAGASPLVVMRRILPTRTCSSREASLAPAQPPPS